MKFFTAASFFALATIAAAAPGTGYGAAPSSPKGAPSSPKGAPPSPKSNQIMAQCGNQNLSCCNKEINKVDAKGVDSDFGVLTGIAKNINLENLSIFDQCSKLDIGLGIIGAGLTDILNQKCKQTVACCQQTESNANGLVAVAVPCIPINAL
ncbi:hypothetical protein LOZ58_001869 [Ophidiomyces ophidiicola]|nr:hypothetical protein LOZ58_001869 [Ophidiomyces ophidiicola]